MTVLFCLREIVWRQWNARTGRSSSGAPVRMSGWFELPPIWPEDRLSSGQLFSIHCLIGVTIAALVAAHIAGALLHHFVRREAFLCARSAVEAEARSLERSTPALRALGEVRPNAAG